MSRERTRPLQTFKQVETVRDKHPEADKQRYATLAYSLPVLLRTAGLAQSVAFLVSRDGNGGKLLASHLAERLELPTDAVKTFEAVAKAPTIKYLAMTAEALSCADWYVRHVQAVLKIDAATARGDRE
jgi:CRISPR-associated protein Cmr5